MCALQKKHIVHLICLLFHFMYSVYRLKCTYLFDKIPSLTSRKGQEKKSHLFRGQGRVFLNLFACTLCLLSHWYSFLFGHYWFLMCSCDSSTESRRGPQLMMMLSIGAHTATVCRKIRAPVCRRCSRFQSAVHA